MTAAFPLVAALLGACAEVPTLRYIDDGLVDGDAAPSPAPTSDGAPATGEDASSPPSTDGGGANPGAGGDSDAACVLPVGVKTGKCCGDVVCVGSHCNATQSCADCAACVGHLLCCATSGNGVKCMDDPSGC